MGFTGGHRGTDVCGRQTGVARGQVAKTEVVQSPAGLVVVTGAPQVVVTTGPVRRRVPRRCLTPEDTPVVVSVAVLQPVTVVVLGRVPPTRTHLPAFVDPDPYHRRRVCGLGSPFDRGGR